MGRRRCHNDIHGELYAAAMVRPRVMRWRLWRCPMYWLWAAVPRVAVKGQHPSKHANGTCAAIPLFMAVQRVNVRCWLCKCRAPVTVGNGASDFRPRHRTVMMRSTSRHFPRGLSWRLHAILRYKFNGPPANSTRAGKFF
mmetsp:Transcript_7693/g.23602  ORF Transcript_7693/g.23602 Transcript_7693/m.23602 type:complete len:140 (-) Transcript_7693:83-502(-)